MTEPELRALPDPVRRYLRHVLPERQRPIRVARMQQHGVLRTDLRRDRWMRFRATETVSPPSRSFCWDATVRILPLIHVQVRDAYANGVGSGRVRLMHAAPIAADADKPELNSASLHRYLAEAVWYPTALLPSAGVRWRGVDTDRAVATLTDAGVAVDLEFRFNAANEVASVHTPGRWRRVGKRYELTPWEGRFRDYRRQQGVLVPACGEVGWYVNDRLEIAWKGDITSVRYEFDESGC